MTKSQLTPAQRRRIFERDGHRCVFCGCGEKERRLHIAHIMPPDGPTASADPDNGQVVCSKHLKSVKEHGALGAAAHMFAELAEKAADIDDSDLKNFCEDVLKTYDKHNINGHIRWR